jgi:hypothetical protein
MRETKSPHKLVLETIRTPRTVATDYVLSRLGLNFRAAEPRLEKNGMWHVPLKALVPASPDIVPRRQDQLYYRFESFGEIVMDLDLKLIEVPRKAILSERFQAELSTLFAKIEKTILEYGSHKWGRIPFIRSFLNPLNAIISQALSLPNISLVKLEQQDYVVYADFLRRAGFLEDSRDSPAHLRKTNQLVAIADKYLKERGFSYYLDDTAIEVTSIIFSQFYPEIRDRIRFVSTYVDTTVAYYVQAVRLKKLVPMTVGDLEYAYNVLGRRVQDEKVTFYGKVADLVTAGFLKWESEGVVSGVDGIYHKVAEFGPDLENNMDLLKALA